MVALDGATEWQSMAKYSLAMVLHGSVRQRTAMVKYGLVRIGKGMVKSSGAAVRTVVAMSSDVMRRKATQPVGCSGVRVGHAKQSVKYSKVSLSCEKARYSWVLKSNEIAVNSSVKSIAATA